MWTSVRVSQIGVSRSLDTFGVTRGFVAKASIFGAWIFFVHGSEWGAVRYGIAPDWEF